MKVRVFSLLFCFLAGPSVFADTDANDEAIRQKLIHIVDGTIQSDLIDIPCPTSMSSTEQIEARFIKCGIVRVPADHDRITGKYVGLLYVKIQKDPSQSKPVLFIDQGGPGGSSVGLALRDSVISPELLKHFDIVAVEQRSTDWTFPSHAEALPSASEMLAVLSADPSNLEFASQLENLESLTLDWPQITTYQMSKDRVFLADKLRVSKFHHYGVSYGTLIGQYLLHFAADRLIRVVLDSPVPPGIDWFQEQLRVGDQITRDTMKRAIEIGRDRGEWSFDFESGVAAIKDKVRALGEDPIVVTLEDFGEEHSLRRKFKDPFQVLGSYKGEKFLEDLIELANSGEVGQVVGLLISILNRDEYLEFSSENILSLLAQGNDDSERSSSSPSLGSIFFAGNEKVLGPSIYCQEAPVSPIVVGDTVSGWSFTLGFLSEEQKDEFLGIEFNPCEFDLPNVLSSNILRAPVESDLPVLVVGSYLDGNTPHYLVEQVNSRLTNATSFKFHDVGHGVFGEEDCITTTIVSFLSHGVRRNQCVESATYPAAN